MSLQDGNSEKKKWLVWCNLILLNLFSSIYFFHFYVLIYCQFSPVVKKIELNFKSWPCHLVISVAKILNLHMP